MMLKKRFTDLLGKRGRAHLPQPPFPKALILTGGPGSPDDSAQSGDSPEASAARGVRLFCESGGPNNSGEEVLYLPTIVDAAESSPTAAKEAAHVIRKFLGKDHFQRAYVQYNAIMLMRILADNPGKTFTRNLDAKFTATTKDLLRDGRDMSVQQILRETLDAFQLHKAQDETLAPLIKMWQTEKAKFGGQNGTYAPAPQTPNAPPFNPQQQNYFSRRHSRRGLPPPHELASRIEEAKTSGKLLLQVVQSTPPNEVAGNELLKEFAERCASASRSIQGYINAEDPAPDEETMLTLIETNEQLSVALSKHQRALLNARKVTGISPSPTPPPPAQPPRSVALQAASIPATAPAPPTVGPVGPVPRLGMPQRREVENPFDDSNRAGEANGADGRPAQEDALGSYRPGYKPTQSYMRRQESSSNNLTMHGATVLEEPEEDEDPGEVRRYRF